MASGLETSTTVGAASKWIAVETDVLRFEPVAGVIVVGSEHVVGAPREAGETVGSSVGPYFSADSEVRSFRLSVDRLLLEPKPQLLQRPGGTT